MTHPVAIGGMLVGPGQKTYIVAEMGINHNGDLTICKKLIDTAALHRCNAVKLQKRTPALCIPANQRNVMRSTPWGEMTYLNYHCRLEFGEADYLEIDRYCHERGIQWFASCWDIPSVDFIEHFRPIAYKIASASLVNDSLLKFIANMERPVILSTGMSTMDDIRHAVSLLNRSQLIITHSTSAYPCKPEELNLRMIETLSNEFHVPIGYSGHEVESQSTLAAVAIGACLVERHITLDKSMWGTDHAAALEPDELGRLVRDIRIVEQALGDGTKRVYESEGPAKERLRGQ